jgi:hypothetical protein
MYMPPEGPKLVNKHIQFRKTPFRSARLTQRYDFWISPISMNLDVF